MNEQATVIILVSHWLAQKSSATTDFMNLWQNHEVLKSASLNTLFDFPG